MGHIINQSLNDDTTIPWHESSRVLLIKTRVILIGKGIDPCTLSVHDKLKYFVTLKQGDQ